MAFKKNFPMNEPDNGVTGDYIKLVGIQTPVFDMDTGWLPGQLTFGVWLNASARASGKTALRLLTIQLPVTFFSGMVILPSVTATLAAIYALKAQIPGLEDAENI